VICVRKCGCVKKKMPKTGRPALFRVHRVCKGANRWGLKSPGGESKESCPHSGVSKDAAWSVQKWMLGELAGVKEARSSSIYEREVSRKGRVENQKDRTVNYRWLSALEGRGGGMCVLAVVGENSIKREVVKGMKGGENFWGGSAGKVALRGTKRKGVVRERTFRTSKKSTKTSEEKASYRDITGFNGGRKDLGRLPHGGPSVTKKLISSKGTRGRMFERPNPSLGRGGGGQEGVKRISSTFGGTYRRNC